ncbi:sulfate adenylyltransferase subunit 1 [Corynebacterium ammoniagenes]|uniref:sulfate adenylyltransferase n=1 Tax=Corynebacterium ammoniagenes DSM 20306 TaxID=649754 RepID=A0ABN0AED1_CORAM|nr:GTP-binding protein [Corynebacterium ammoniagenes]APT83516.1 sulfate adenylyltransferase [Corynebacterium ammoniagenes DSM 20306]AQS74516.1 sulfate adenylyltransferase [Corynebacterium ammoniagenes]EFG81143.1 sulfate adenylyltransferase, large subunit [Corynebacterium ammoniagenes DSM 20306]
MSSVATLKTRETLRLCTAGSVDDGKSTFVGRLLHDTKSVLADQLESMEKSSKDRGFDGLDLSLLVDGLRAEREQGITIDVAYRYFATDKRTFILADTPGHVQYTRNTVTGMSTSQVVVVLIDARHGVVEQTRRHLNVAALLGVRHVILAVNKIDLVDFSESVFRDIEADFTAVADRLGIEDTSAVPISALRGDNVVEPSANMPWYEGPTVLELLESYPVAHGRATELDFRLPIQYVIREHASDYRGYAGRIEAGSVKVGDTVYLDGGRTSTVTHIDRPEPAESAVNGDSVVLRLADDIDLARGDLISGSQRPEAVRSFEATVVALTEKDLRVGPMYKIRYGSKVVKGRITAIERALDLDNVADDVLEPEKVALNDIAHINVEVAEELPVEDYAARGAVGNFLVTDSSTGNTLAAGLIGHRLR